MYYDGLRPLRVGGHSLNAGLAGLGYHPTLVLGPLFWESHPPPWGFYLAHFVGK